MLRPRNKRGPPRRYTIGTICHWTDGKRALWCIVERHGKRGAPYGRCFYADGAKVTNPGSYSLGSELFEEVTEDAVPDEVWTELAKWSLLQ